MSNLLASRRDERYDFNAEDPTMVAAFDTDYTMRYADGPVPLDHIRRLRDDPDVAVYATGYNQTLRSEAGIPGMVEILDHLGRDIGEHIDRPNRMRLLDEVHPEATRRVVVDDVDLRELESEGWRYYQPAEYVVEVMGVGWDEWEAELGVGLRDYLRSLTEGMGRFPTSALELDSDTPYTDRTRNGVGATTRSRSTGGGPLGERFPTDSPWDN